MKSVRLSFSRGGSSHSNGCDPEAILEKVASAAHAMAQPLTLFRSLLAIAESEQISESDRRGYVNMLAEHIEQLCGHFTSIQEIIGVRQHKLNMTPESVFTLIAPIVEDWRCVLEDGGVDFRSLLPDGDLHVSCDRKLTERALFASFGVANAISKAGELVEIEVRGGEDTVEILIQKKESGIRQLRSSERLALDISELSMKTQRADFRVDEEPFLVSFKLPRIVVPLASSASIHFRGIKL